jgi:HYDIN/CFA65/VesB-like, Ig-like domain
VNFGQVKVNKTTSKHFTIQNKGKFPLDVTVGSLTPPFTISSGSFTLSKGKKKTVTVKFMPTATGPAPPEILTIHSDDPVHGSHPVTVTGTGK